MVIRSIRLWLSRIHFGDGTSRLTLEFGYASESGPREQNEDYGGYVTPDPALAATKGVLGLCFVALLGLNTVKQRWRTTWGLRQFRGQRYRENPS